MFVILAGCWPSGLLQSLNDRFNRGVKKIRWGQIGGANNIDLEDNQYSPDPVPFVIVKTRFFETQLYVNRSRALQDLNEGEHLSRNCQHTCCYDGKSHDKR